jgi:two-component system phosphate regulon response regulator OmpR
MSKKILVCDDEAHLREMVTEYLEEREFQVMQAAGAEELREKVAEDPPDLIILDIRMPQEDGLSALRRLNAEVRIPVIMLTAAADTVDRIVGLELGADDYIGKPVDLRELEARIKAVLRRNAPDAGDGSPLVRGTVPFGHCALDLEGARLFGPDKEEIQITAMEFSLLKLFAQNQGRVLTRDQILENAHDRDWEPFDRSIDLRISRLRRKIEVNPNRPAIIRTVRGVGYIFG